MSRARQRLASVDAFRGLTIAAMMLVNKPGNWDAVYAPLRHAGWNGCTPTDLIFPFLLFIAVGEPPIPASAWLYLNDFLPWAGPLKGSLACALANVLVSNLVAEVLYQRRIFLSI